MKLKKLLTMTFAAVLLAGCTVEGNSSKVSSPNNSTNSTSSTSVISSTPNGSNASTSGNNGTSTSASTSGNNGTSTSTSTSTSTPGPVVDDTYMIRIIASNGVTITPSTYSAAKGEIVTLTVEVADGYKLESLTANDVPLQGSENNGVLTYSFIMGDRSVTIKTTVSVDGEVTLTGDVAAVLTLQDDGKTYAAYNVEVPTNSFIAFTVGGQQLSITKIDRTKSFADIDLGPMSKNGGFTLAGGAKYNFFYNPDLGDECCYIQRTEVTTLPSDSNSLWSLFDGSVKSEPSTYPEGLVGVKFSSTESYIEYEWNLYDDNSSFATVKPLGSSQVVANVSKKVEDGVYKVVDTYIESTYDQTRRDDTRAYSAKYSIVDQVASEFGDHQITEHDALFEVRNPSHDINSIDFDIMYAYRVGFDMEWDDSLKAYTRNITSTSNADGTFTVDVDSSKTIESAETTTLSRKHTTYKVQLTFTKAGAPLSGTYIEKEYNDSEFNFSTYDFYPGGEFGGREVMALEFEYTYGTPKTNDVVFDDSIYFAKSIDATVHNAKLYPNAKNTLNQTDLVEDYLAVEANPNTALDLWQYRVTNSSNENVIAKRDSFQTRYVAKDLGTSTLTIGNDSTNDVTTTVDVTVVNNIKVRSFYMQGVNSDGRPVYDDFVCAAYAYVLANTVKNVYVAPSPSNAPVTFTATSSDESLLKVTVNGQIMTLDTTGAKNIVEETSVQISIHSDYYDSWTGFTPTTFEIRIQPNAIPASGPLGTWVNTAEGVSVTFTDTPSTYATNCYVAYVTTAKDSNVEFAYSFNDKTGVVTISGALIGDKTNGNTFAGYFAFTGKGTIEGALAYTYDDYSAGETKFTDIIGEYYIDEENFGDFTNTKFVELIRTSL